MSPRRDSMLRVLFTGLGGRPAGFNTRQRGTRSQTTEAVSYTQRQSSN